MARHSVLHPSNLTQAVGHDPTQIEHSVYEVLLNPTYGPGFATIATRSFSPNTFQISRSRLGLAPSPPAPLPQGERGDSVSGSVRLPLSRSGRGGWGVRAERRQIPYSKRIASKTEILLVTQRITTAGASSSHQHDSVFVHYSRCARTTRPFYGVMVKCAES